MAGTKHNYFNDLSELLRSASEDKTPDALELKILCHKLLDILPLLAMSADHRLLFKSQIEARLVLIENKQYLLGKKQARESLREDVLKLRSVIISILNLADD